MITHSEAEFFARCAERVLGMEGQIVDLGCWMGSTAVALAEGIRRAGGDDRVRAFDIFRWEMWMEREHARLTYGIYRPGDSFLPEARRIVREHGHGLIELQQADLTVYHWTGEPIKLLLIDAMKSLPLVQQIARTFFPCLVPGALVLHQDFKLRFTPWLHLLHYRLRGHFRIVESVERGGTVGFEVVEPITLEAVESASDLATIGPDEVDEAFKFSQSLLPTDQRWNIAGAHVVYYCRQNQAEHVRRVADIYLAENMGVPPEQCEELKRLALDAANAQRQQRTAAQVVTGPKYAPLRDPKLPAAETWPACDYFVMPQRKVLYAPIQKAACSSVKLWWAEAADGWLGVDPVGMNAEATRKQTHFALSQRFVYWRHYADLGDAPLVDPEWFRFALVRNPWSRLVSAFVNKFVELTDHGTLFIDDFRERAEKRLPRPLAAYHRELRDWTSRFTFRQFVEHLAECNLAEVDLHWRPQVEFLTGTEFHFIGRIERLEQDFATICERIGVSIPLRMSNVSQYLPPNVAGECVADWPLARLRETCVPHYQRFFSPDLIELVGRLYAADVERFGYSFDGIAESAITAPGRRAA